MKILSFQFLVFILPKDLSYECGLQKLFNVVVVN